MLVIHQGQVLWLLLASCALLLQPAAAISAKAEAKGSISKPEYADYNLEEPTIAGRYEPLLSHAQLKVTTSPGVSAELKLTVTSPKVGPGGDSVPPGSFPLVLLFAAAKLPTSYYKSYARYLASWGYVVLQYDFAGRRLKRQPTDLVEVGLMPQLLAWAEAQARDPATALYEVVDIRRVGVMGHARGGKLAGLLLAGGDPRIRTAVLLDPVDVARGTRGRPGYPSAAAALQAAGSNRSAAVVGAGITGWCNPAAEGWRKFAPVLARGSWLQVLDGAGHMQFTDAKGPSAWSADTLCRAGNVSHKEVIKCAAVTAASWLQLHLPPGAASAHEAPRKEVDARSGSGVSGLETGERRLHAMECPPVKEL